MTLNIYKSPEEAIQQIADFFINIASASINQKGRFSVALSGGSSPKRLYELLASDYKEKLDWKKCYFFFGDERYVPQTDDDSNYLMVKTSLFDPLEIPSANIFPIDSSAEPSTSGRLYMDNLREHFGEENIKFDLILLGLGADAHTASLFPGTSIVSNSTEEVREVWLQQQQTYRITFTAPLINNAHHIAFLVYGPDKANAVQKVLEAPEHTDKYPAQLIKTETGDMQWFIDEAAAQKLTKKYKSFLRSLSRINDRR